MNSNLLDCIVKKMMNHFRIKYLMDGNGEIYTPPVEALDDSLEEVDPVTEKLLNQLLSLRGPLNEYAQKKMGIRNDNGLIEGGNNSLLSQIMQQTDATSKKLLEDSFYRSYLTKYTKSGMPKNVAETQARLNAKIDVENSVKALNMQGSEGIIDYAQLGGAGIPRGVESGVGVGTANILIPGAEKDMDEGTIESGSESNNSQYQGV